MPEFLCGKTAGKDAQSFHAQPSAAPCIALPATACRSRHLPPPPCGPPRRAALSSHQGEPQRQSCLLGIPGAGTVAWQPRQGSQTSGSERCCARRRMPPTRDPFPYPRYENEDTFTGQARPGQVPRDSLDFKLTSLYNHHKEQLRDKSEIVIHKETLLDDHGALKGLEPVKEPEPPPMEHRTARGLSVRCWVSPTKESIHSIEGAIECPHTAATNSGYSRKENGGFFSQ
uniref:Uncharacterized protein n=2 Tax=Gopherus TaxID=38771 RepID=A0A452HQK8_9SAUR